MVIIDYKPEISLEQIMAFDPARPETFTHSAFINAVCESFAKNGYMNCKDMGRSVGMNDRRFSYTFEVLTGHKYSEVRSKFLTRKARELHREHPRWGTKRLAQALGFRSRASLWAILPKDLYRQLRPETKAAFLRRMAKEFDKLGD